jgi:hypothetical protein
MRLSIKTAIVACIFVLIGLIGSSTSSASNGSTFKLTNYNRVFSQVKFSFMLIKVSDTNSYQSLDNKLDNVRNKLSNYHPSQSNALRKSFMTSINALNKQIIFNYRLNYQTNIKATEKNGQQLQASLNNDYRTATQRLYSSYKQKMSVFNKRMNKTLRKLKGKSLNSRVRKYNLKRNKLLSKWRADRKINILYNQYNQFYNTIYQKTVLRINNNQLQSKNQATVLTVNNYRLLDNKINQINLLLKRVNSSFVKIEINKTLPVIESNIQYLKKIAIKSPVPEPSSKPPSLGVNPLVIYQKSKLICSIGSKYLKEKRRVNILKKQIIENNQLTNQLQSKGADYQVKISDLNKKINSLVSKLNSASITEYDRYTQQIAGFKKEINSIRKEQAADQRRIDRLSARNKNNQKLIATAQVDVYKQKQNKLLRGVRAKIKQAAYKRCPKQII